jgi:hypothetical protein
MGRQPNARQTLSFSSPAQIIVLVVFFFSLALSPGRSQTLQGNVDAEKLESSDAAGLPVPALPAPSTLTSDRPSASEQLHPGALAIPAPRPSLTVIGFAGGFIRRDSSAHGEIRLAMDLREKYGSTIHAEIFENHHGDEAHREILRLLGSSNGALSASEKKAARIILYGHSWGASEAVAVARQLKQDGIPVLLLVQVDGVAKGVEDDGVIPSNVAQAINFYQSDGLLHGRSMIRAANPATTEIIGNIRFTYKDAGVPCPGYPWLARVFTKPHIEIENDPRVWNEVEAMILSRAG